MSDITVIFPVANNSIILFLPPSRIITLIHKQIPVLLWMLLVCHTSGISLNAGGMFDSGSGSSNMAVLLIATVIVIVKIIGTHALVMASATNKWRTWFWLLSLP
jgi:hypothetical protein